ncbi:replication protein [gut metagenome]|uniref:Replication protein n=1 Tax=gut metagenome TaxID=749906 RepID=J9F9K4_9ZZZZ
MEEEKVVVVSDADPVKRRDVVVVPVAEIEKEFEAKSLALADEFFEVGLQGFLMEVFERDDVRIGEMGVQPFEEVQSVEYRNWRQQKQQLAVKREQGVPEVQLVMDYSGYGCWRYNPIVFYQEVVDGQKKNLHRIILKDDDASLLFISGRKFAIMSPITYVGRNNTQENARYLYAMAFDLDGVSMRCHHKMFDLVEKGIMPMPNLIVNSGHGYHLYYLLENPVALYPVIVPLLNRVKHGLTNILWNMGTSELEDRQYQSILQSFRLPGTLTKFGKRIRAFVTRSDRYTLEDLNKYLSKYKLSPEELSVCTGKAKYNPKGVTLSEAKRMWPEWYFSRVVQKKRVGRKWHVNRAVYDWWLHLLQGADDEIKEHHRYWCILTLVIYAVKCDVPRDEVLADALALVHKMDSYTKTEDNHFTESDVYDAMLAYDENYNKWPIKTIEDTTLFRIERNRRNGRKQDVHLKAARAMQTVLDPDGSWREGNGRKAQRDIVKQWKEKNPDNNNKSQCAKETGLSRPTVRKWWNPDKVVVPDASKSQAKKAEKPENKPVLVDMVQLFAPGSTYTILGYTHNEVVEIMTTGRWQELGWKVIIS